MDNTREIDTTITTTPAPSRTRYVRPTSKRVNVVAGMKWCPKCEHRLSTDAFGIARDREDGLTGWCRSCRAERTRARRAENPVEACKDVNERYRTNPERWHAKVAVARAVERGELQRPEVGTPRASAGRCRRSKRTTTSATTRRIGSMSSGAAARAARSRTPRRASHVVAS